MQREFNCMSATLSSCGGKSCSSDDANPLGSYLVGQLSTVQPVQHSRNESTNQPWEGSHLATMSHVCVFAGLASRRCRQLPLFGGTESEIKGKESMYRSEEVLWCSALGEIAWSWTLGTRWGWGSGMGQRWDRRIICLLHSKAGTYACP